MDNLQTELINLLRQRWPHLTTADFADLWGCSVDRAGRVLRGAAQSGTGLRLAEFESALRALGVQWPGLRSMLRDAVPVTGESWRAASMLQHRIQLGVSNRDEAAHTDNLSAKAQRQIRMALVTLIARTRAELLAAMPDPFAGMGEGDAFAACAAAAAALSGKVTHAAPAVVVATYARHVSARLAGAVLRRTPEVWSAFMVDHVRGHADAFRTRYDALAAVVPQAAAPAHAFDLWGDALNAQTQERSAALAHAHGVPDRLPDYPLPSA